MNVILGWLIATVAFYFWLKSNRKTGEMNRSLEERKAQITLLEAENGELNRSLEERKTQIARLEAENGELKSAQENANKKNNTQSAPTFDREKYFGDSLSYCDCKQCSKNDKCTDFERMFCCNVMGKLFPHGGFTAQYPVCFPSGIRKADFAFVISDDHKDKKIAIELDDYESHSKNSHDDLGEQLSRQNEFILNGWQVLRFSNRQAHNAAEDCIAQIKELVGERNLSATKIPFRVLNDFNEISIDDDIFKELRVLISGLRCYESESEKSKSVRYFLANLQTERSLAKWKITPWLACPYKDENGKKCRGVAHTKIYLKTKYEEKDIVKNLANKFSIKLNWNKDLKNWSVPAGADFSKFGEWLQFPMMWECQICRRTFDTPKSKNFEYAYSPSDKLQEGIVITGIE